MKEDLQAVLNHIVLLRETYKQIVKAYNISVNQYQELTEEAEAQGRLLYSALESSNTRRNRLRN